MSVGSEEKAARSCPFCGSTNTKYFGVRGQARFDRCKECASIFMQVSRQQFERLHLTTWEDEGFIHRIEGSLGNAVPDERTWREVEPFFPKTGAILEIGPGTGHLLAAAKQSGREVVGVETSEVHRKYISSTWGIDAVYDSMDGIPAGKQFAGVIVINTIEHIYDVAGFLKALTRFIQPGGAVFISTCNASALLAKVCGTMWSMFKQPDHVSFPSAKGFQAVGAQVGLRAVRVWSHELPFETPLGVAVAARDWARERGGPPKNGHSSGPAGGEDSDRTAASAKLQRLTNRLRKLDFSTPLTSSLGVASAIKVVYTPK